MKTETCLGACGRRLPKTDDHFICRRFARAYPNGRVVELEAWDRHCRACRRAVQSRVRMEVSARKRAERGARMTIACHGPCGREKPATIENFARRPSGDWFLTCRTCAAHAAATYRRSAAYGTYKTRCRKRRRARAARYRAANTERTRRYFEVRKDDPAFVRHRKLVWCLKVEVDAGRMKKPDHCARCRRGPSGGFKLRARFTTNPERIDAVEWLCGPHHWAATCGARYLAEVAEERRDDARADVIADPLRAVTIPRDEWLAIHAAHAARLEAEEGPVDASYQAERARYREAFRGTVFSVGCRERLRRALAIQPSAGRG